MEQMTKEKLKAWIFDAVFKEPGITLKDLHKRMSGLRIDGKKAKLTKFDMDMVIFEMIDEGLLYRFYYNRRLKIPLSPISMDYVSKHAEPAKSY